MKSFFAFSLGLLLTVSQTANADQWRIFKEAKSGRSLTAKIVSKNPEIEHVELALKSGKTVWLDVKRLSDADQDYIHDWPNNDRGTVTGGDIDIRLKAKTVAMGASQVEWHRTWGKFDENGAQILKERGLEKSQDRVLGITIENRGSVEEYVIEIFWLGFVLRDKRQRVINSLSSKFITIPAGTLSEPSRYNVRVGSNFDYREYELLYKDFDFVAKTVESLYVGIWQGYGYAGWAVRVSDKNGKLVAQTAAQPVFLPYIERVPVPTVSR